VKPGATEQGIPLRERYDPASYDRIKTLVRELADEYLGPAVGTLQRNYMEKVLVARLRQRAAMERTLNQRRRWLAGHRNLSHSFLGSLLLDAADPKTFHQYARFLAEHEDEGLPDYHQLRRCRLLSGQTVDWIEQLKTRLNGAMDLAVVREYGPNPGQRWPPKVESVR